MGGVETLRAEVGKLKKRNLDLCIAFESVDVERKHWRRQAERLRELIEQMQSFMRPYECPTPARATSVADVVKPGFATPTPGL